MKDSEAVNSYTIKINKKRYIFTCPDGEEHVEELQNKLTKTIDSVSGQDQGFILSDHAMKVALVLADEAISENRKRENQIGEIEQKVASMLAALDTVLDSDPQF